MGDLSVQIQKLVATQSFPGFVGLGIGKGYPNFRNFFWGKKFSDVVDVRAQEANILQIAIECGFGTGPHAIALNVHADVVDFGVHASKSHGIIAFSTGQFCNNGVVIAKNLRPTSFVTGIFNVKGVGEVAILLKFDEFGFAHRVAKVQIPPRTMHVIKVSMPFLSIGDIFEGCCRQS